MNSNTIHSPYHGFVHLIGMELVALGETIKLQLVYVESILHPWKDVVV